MPTRCALECRTPVQLHCRYSVCVLSNLREYLNSRAFRSRSFTQTHPIMVAKSFSSSALILLLLVSISSAARIVSIDQSSYVDTTSRAPVRLPPKKPKTKAKSSRKRKPSRKPTGPEPVFTYMPPTQVKAVWGATTILTEGTNTGSQTLLGWAQIGADVVAAGGKIASSNGGTSDRARCHMIGKALGGKGITNNLFSCFAYFNSPGMSYFEKELKKEIKNLSGTDQCEMTVTLSFTQSKQYPEKVNMNAKCAGSQLFNVNIDNEFQKANVAVQHLCKPTIALHGIGFQGPVTIARGASAC